MAGGTLTEIRHALGDTLRNVQGLRVSEHMPEQINPPLGVIQLDRVDYHGAMVGGLRRFEFLIILIVGRMGERTAQEHLDRLTDFDGTDSIRQTIEADPTLGGVAWATKVNAARGVRPISIGDNNYLAVEFEMEVSA